MLEQVKELMPIRINSLDCVVSMDYHEEAVLDGDIYLSLFTNETCIGISGISFGLEEYYEDVGEFPEPSKEKYLTAILSAKNKWGVTQMQGVKGTTELRKKISYRKVLMNTWKDISQKLGFDLTYYLPAELNFWSIPSIIDQSRDPPPTKNCLKVNYDNNAKKNGYEYDSDKCLFVKKDTNK